MFIQYIKSYFFSLKKNRFFYIINFIGFSVAFLLLTIILTFVYQEISFDKFHKNNNNIYRLHPEEYGVTPICFADKLKNKIPEIRNIIRFSSIDLSININDEILDLGKAYFTDPEVFQVFSFKLLSGNASNALKDPFSIVISQLKAEELFPGSSPIGKTIKDKNGIIYTITGVMEDIPYNSHIQANAFASIETLRYTGNEKNFNCGSWSILTYIYLAENSILKETEIKINDVLEEFRMDTGNGKIPLILEPMGTIYFNYSNNKYDGAKHGNFQTVVLYLAISFLLSFVAITNYINLSTAISIRRIKEIAIKKINGAKTSHIIIQTVTEAISTALISFIIALLVIEFFLPQLCTLLNIKISSTFNRLNLYLFYFVGTLTIGIITGLFPGIFLSKVDEIKALKNETILKSHGFRRKILTTFQLLIVAILLNATFIVKSQINYITKKDIGFNYENVVTFNLPQEIIAKKEILKDKLLENTDIKAVSFSNGLIGKGFTKAPKGNHDNKELCYFYSIDPDYLKLYKINIKHGRDFSWNLKTDLSNSCIINEEACRALGFENPLNEMLDKKQIIGVVHDFNFTSLHNQIEPLAIYCSENGNIAQVKISNVNQNNTLKYIENTCKSISNDFNFNYTFLKDRIKSLYKAELVLKNSFQFYSFITFIVALLGLLGLTLFSLKRRNKEACIRKLFGAKLQDTLLLLTKEQSLIVLIANIMAIPLTFVIMNKWLNNFEFRVNIGYLIFIKTLFITYTFTLLTTSYLILKIHKTSMIESLKNE